MIFNGPRQLIFKGRAIIGLAKLAIVTKPARPSGDLTHLGMTQQIPRFEEPMR